MYVCMYICMYVCMYVCVCDYMPGCRSFISRRCLQWCLWQKNLCDKVFYYEELSQYIFIVVG